MSPRPTQHGLTPRLLEREERSVDEVTRVDVGEVLAEVGQIHPEVTFRGERQLHLLAVFQRQRFPLS